MDLCICVLCTPANTLTNSLDVMTVQKELNEFILNYCDTFRPGNIDEVAKFYHLPVTMIFKDRVAVLNSRAEVMLALQSIMDDLVKRDFSHSRVDECHAHQLTDIVGLLSAKFSRIKADGTVLERLGATYTVINNGDSYKITVLIAHEPETTIKF